MARQIIWLNPFWKTTLSTRWIVLNADGSIRDVLVIDDNPDDLRLIGKILTDDGRYKAILAEGGRMGWDIISSGKPPHAVILDLFMPEMDGFKILENMQAIQKLRDIPVIVISGMDLTAEQKNQLNEFGQRLLSKGSFNEKELLTSIQRSLGTSSAQNNKQEFVSPCHLSSNALIVGTTRHTTQHPQHAQSATANGVKRSTIMRLLGKPCQPNWSSRPFDLWRYRELLPVRNPNISLSLGEGGTPLIRAVNLGMMLGCPNIYIKDERQGPTSSFKDRQASVTIAALKEAGITEMVAASTGNVAISYSAYASRAGMKLWAFVTSLVPAVKMREIALYGSQVIKITGSYDQCKQVAAEFARQRHLYQDMGARTITSIEAMKTIAFEIAEQLTAIQGPEHESMRPGAPPIGMCRPLAAAWDRWAFTKASAK